MLTYADENKLGRQRATQVIDECRSTGDLPRLVREIREAAADESGFGVGFLFQLAEIATAGCGAVSRDVQR